MSELSARAEFRIAADLKREVEEAAALLGVSFTAFATQALIQRAREVKREHHLTLLSGEAAEELARLVAEPPAPSDALRQTLSARTIEI